jgi:flagella basal body P-ring formation protein FlgA
VSSTVFASAASIAVKSESTVRGPWLTLGDIANVSGDSPERVKQLKELKLGDVPSPGTTVFMTPVSLEPKLVATHADFSNISWSVPDNFKITTLSQPVGGRQIAEQAQRYLTQASMGATLALTDIPADIQAPLGKLELTPEIVGAIRYNGPTTVNVTVRADGQNFVKVPVQFDVKRYLDVVVAAANLNAGEILSEQALRLERVDAGRLPAGYLTELSKAVGLQIRYAVAPGGILYEKALSRPILVRSGENIRLMARIGELEISAAGIALSQGAAGDLIRVQNSTTRKILTGRVQEDKSVLVLNQ